MKVLSRGGALTVLAVLGILLVFFCPARTGPYSVTNGPATVFRALEAADAVFVAMSTALLVAFMQCYFRLESLTRNITAVNYDPEIFTLRC